MFRGLFVPFVFLAHLVAASDDSVLLRQQEAALADAVKAKNRATLSLLTDRNFHIDWNSGSAFRNARINVGREDWLADLSHLHIASYNIQISSVHAVSRSPVSSTVKLNELWVLLSPEGRIVTKRVDATDLWVKQDGVWKLAVRLCRSDVQTSLP